MNRRQLQWFGAEETLPEPPALQPSAEFSPWRGTRTYNAWSAMNRAEYYHDGNALGPLIGYTSEVTGPWKSPFYLPRKASRITRDVIGVRREHLHDMPKSDVYAEGLSEEYVRHFREWYDGQAPWMAFAQKWDEMHGHRAPWSSNPLVTVITFRREAS